MRGHKVMLDEDLADLYGIEIRALLQAVKRNQTRFPSDFMFQLTTTEWADLRSQSVILKKGRGVHRKYRPHAFTEQGVAMLSSVLRSKRAVAVNIQIMRAFVRMREMLVSSATLARKLEELEKKHQHHDEAIVAILSAIRELMNPPPPKRRGIAFTADFG